MISVTRQRIKYVASDYIMSAAAILVYNCVRYWLWEERLVADGFFSLKSFLLSANVMLGQALFPLAMMCLYWLSGYYTEVIRKSRIQELLATLQSAFISAMIVFFVAMINDLVADRASNYEMILILTGIIFVCLYFARATITSHAQKKLHRGEWKFNTLIIGAGYKAAEFDRRLAKTDRILGYNVVGMVPIPGEKKATHISKPTYSIDFLADTCQRLGVTELIVIPTKNDAKMVLAAINKLFLLGLPIKISPDMYNILVSRVRLTDFHGEPLVDISGGSMPAGQSNIKRLADCIVSALCLVILSPFLLIVAIAIKRESPGGAIYKQERIGYRNKPFTIYKFRTMRLDAESDGVPRLSSDTDDRVTRIGRFLRKYRIDELPQFWNVLRGDMSLVGPRPERQFYIDQIVERAPFYTLLHQVRPGITSMGMVKYGYAKNVEQMIERMRYDLMYLENMSLLNDIKILAYTVETVLTGKGI